MSFDKKYLYKQTARNIFKNIWNLPLELKIVISLFTIGMIVGVTCIFYTSKGNVPPQFYQDQFAPAVMLTCGRGYINPDALQTPQQLSDFLNLKVDTFSCDYLPGNLLTSPLNKFQEVQQYLMGTVAFFWRLFGISWKALTPLYGIFYGATAAISYGIFRLGMGRALAFVGTLSLIISPIHLLNILRLRDYSKSPFILALVLIMGYMVKQPLKRTTLLGLSAAGGLLVGFGLGFRMDLLICIPAFIGAVLIFLPRRVLAKTRLQIVAVFVACFFIAGLPIISSLSGGGNTFHVILLGFASIFDEKLGVASFLYKWVPGSHDDFVYSMLNSYSYRINHNYVPLITATREYEQVGLQYFLEIVKNFPSDMLSRVYAASLKILAMPFDINQAISSNLINDMHNPTIKKIILDIYDGYHVILSPFIRVTYLIAAIALLMLSTRSLRVATFSLLFLIYFAGYPALQFHNRHYFHLEFISLWAWGFVLQQAFQLINKNSSNRHQFWTIIYQPRHWWNSSVQRSILFVLAACFFLTSPLYALRWYQSHHLGWLFKSYSTASMEQLNLARTSLDEKTVLIQGVNFAQTDYSDTKKITAEYLVAEFDKSRCKVLELSATFRYKKQVVSVADFSTSVSIGLAASYDNLNTATRVFFPVYYSEALKFKGIEISQDRADCVTALYRVKELRKFPMLLILTLPPNWEQLTRYQTLKSWEGQEDNEHSVPVIKSVDPHY